YGHTIFMARRNRLGWEVKYSVTHSRVDRLWVAAGNSGAIVATYSENPKVLNFHHFNAAWSGLHSSLPLRSDYSFTFDHFYLHNSELYFALRSADRKMVHLVFVDKGPSLLEIAVLPATPSGYLSEAEKCFFNGDEYAFVFIGDHAHLFVPANVQSEVTT